MTRRYDVSVIVPAYKAANTIRRAVASVAAQTVRPGEVVIVDDGSTDGTAVEAEACRGFLGDISLIVVTQPNQGAGAARNRAIRESSGTILAFLDADDEWLPAKLERSLAVMEVESLDLVAHNGWIDDRGLRTLNDCAARYGEPGDPYDTLYRKGYIDTCTVLVKRALVYQAGGFDENLPNAQDFELWLAMLQSPARRFRVFDEVLSVYYIVPGSIMSYTDRRRRCTLAIAQCYAAALVARGLPAFYSLLWRVLVVHIEAVTAQRARGEWGRLVLTLVKLPLELLIASFRFKFGTKPIARRSWTEGAS